MPVGPDNGFNGEDMGQPEFFETRRQQFAFKVDVPSTFPKDRDLIWTLKANGVTLKAFGCLWPVWEIDQHTISANRGSRTAVDFDEPPNEPPQIVDPLAAANHRCRQAALVDGVGHRRWQSQAADGPRRARRGHQEARRETRGAAAQPVAQSELDPVAGARHRDLRSESGAGRRRESDDHRRVRQAGRYVLRAYAEDASIHTPHNVQIIVVSSSASPQQ